MQAWSNFETGSRYHKQHGMAWVLTGIGIALNHEDGPEGCGSDFDDAVGNGGVGRPEKLTISAAGFVASLEMPSHMAFGIAGVLHDSKEKVIADSATDQRERPFGSILSSINIWGTKPIPDVCVN